MRHIKAKGLKFHLFLCSKSFFSFYFTSTRAAANLYMTYVNTNTCITNIPRNTLCVCVCVYIYIYVDNKEIYCIFKICCIMSVLFSTNAISFIILSFFVPIILMFFRN